VFMMASVALIGAVIVLEARPVYSYLSARAFGTETDMTEMVLGFGAATLLCLGATFIPLMIAIQRLEEGER